ncbi:hypothetical protein SteCoe_19688 [Stentor coeruleus]|uniref:Septin-type G domain-containing protein n=1 Tax=Stentor coeruleus TaxID=5963 RepID=A0A1R2BU84_9CILI|nr:hypothetical protein SteCoe_19688 [Stentor coeruleus]
MSSDKEFLLLPNSPIESPENKLSLRGLHRISSASTIKSVYIESHSNSPCSSVGQKNELQLIKEAQMKRLNKPVNLNILFLGDSNIGKTSLINAMLLKYFGIMNSKLEKPNNLRPTRTVIESNGSISSNELELRVMLIDTPGYGFFSTKEKWLETMRELIIGKALDYKKIKKQVPKNILEDNRVHVALFFIEGPRCKETDLDLMYNLQKYISIIPILAKADSYSKNELVQVKVTIISQCAEAGISFYDTSSAMGNKVIELSSSPLGPVPPFAIISGGDAIEKNGKTNFVRKYTWGQCDIHDKNCSDFRILCRLLFGHLVIPILDTAKFLNKKNLKSLKNNEKKIKSHNEFNKNANRFRRISNFAARFIFNML